MIYDTTSRIRTQEIDYYFLFLYRAYAWSPRELIHSFGDELIREVNT